MQIIYSLEIVILSENNTLVTSKRIHAICLSMDRTGSYFA